MAISLGVWTPFSDIPIYLECFKHVCHKKIQGLFRLRFTGCLSDLQPARLCRVWNWTPQTCHFRIYRLSEEMVSCAVFSVISPCYLVKHGKTICVMCSGSFSSTSICFFVCPCLCQSNLLVTVPMVWWVGCPIPQLLKVVTPPF